MGQPGYEQMVFCYDPAPG